MLSRILTLFFCLVFLNSSSAAQKAEQSAPHKAGYIEGFSLGVKGAETTFPHNKNGDDPEFIKGFFEGQYDGLRKFHSATMGDDYVELLRNSQAADLIKIRIDPQYAIEGIEIYLENAQSEKTSLSVAAIGRKRFDLRFDITLNGAVLNKQSVVLSSMCGMAVAKVELARPTNIDASRGNLLAVDPLLFDEKDLTATNIKFVLK